MLIYVEIFNKLSGWYNRNFYQTPTWDESEYEIEVKNIEHGGSKAVPVRKIFIESQEKVSLAPEKSYMWDKLDEIFSEQKAFTNQINDQYKDNDFKCYNMDKFDYDIYYDLNCAIEELVEAIRELNTKKWKQKKKVVDKKKVLEEMVDASKFIHQAIIRLGYNANDYFEMHKTKDEENKNRQKNGY